MISVEIKVTDGDTVIVNATVTVPDLWVAADVIAKTSDLLSDHIETRHAGELQEN